ncbi:MAG: sugar phosphate isomerase/epimerase [Cytophagia bacterium]|nr:MAG: sugar phosphate isomerase/epimerase [Cytophagales bacterium]TAG39131.1 MAG: sugar phosphate isomerase/epimerase [Cytophagia bacterium]TAG80801.1 MAG: sugar phosphate isomerase/epimerase [Cytophagales bacterium]
MNKIGFNVLAWTAGMSEDLLPILDRLKTIGYDGVEFFVGAPESPIYQQVGNHCRQLGLEVTTVTVVSPDANPINESAAVRAKGLERIKWAIDRSQELGSQLLAGPFHSAHAHFAAHPALDEEYARAAEILHAAGDYAAQANILLTPEALNRFECYLCNTMQQLAHLIKMTAHPHVQGMFDTHHANIEEKRYDTAIQTIAPFLRHVHISENDRGTPGDGHVPFDDAFAGLAAVGYKGWLTIEAFSRNDPDFANAINVWREYNNPWHIAENGLAFIKEMGAKHGL